jgi:hypothetical protein
MAESASSYSSTKGRFRGEIKRSGSVGIILGPFRVGCVKVQPVRTVQPRWWMRLTVQIPGFCRPTRSPSPFELHTVQASGVCVSPKR